MHMGHSEFAHAEKTVSVTFHLDDPHALTDTDQAVWELKAAKGQPLLEVAVDAGINIEHACGGVCACSTCHVIVRSGLDSCNEATDDEEDMLDLAPGLHPQSRLACQCVPDGTKSIIVEIPEWNRNLVSESH